MTLPPVVVFNILPEAMLVIAKVLVVAFVKYDEDEANIPPCAQIGEVVAAEIKPKLVDHVNALAAPVEVWSAAQPNLPAPSYVSTLPPLHVLSPAPKRLVEEAVDAKKVPVVVALPLIVDEAEEIKPFVNVWRLLQVFVVVVPNARLKTPVAGVYWIG